MSREGLQSDEPVLRRRKGLLVNRRAEGNSRTGVFYCDCDCGAVDVEVSARKFNDGLISGCPQCRFEGKAPDLHPNLPKRLSVSVDSNSVAALGFDVETITGAQVRQLLADFAAVVLRTPLPLQQKSERERLLRIVQERPDLLDTNRLPSDRLLEIASTAGDCGEWYLEEAEALAVLAALRWGLSHPDTDWWKSWLRVE